MQPKPNYIMLTFHELAEKIGEPVYVVYPEHDEVAMVGCEPRKKKIQEYECWEIVNGIRRIRSGDYVMFKGSTDWLSLENIKVYKK